MIIIEIKAKYPLPDIPDNLIDGVFEEIKSHMKGYGFVVLSVGYRQVSDNVETP